MVNEIRSAPMPLVSPCCGAPLYVAEGLNRNTGFHEPDEIGCTGEGCMNYWTKSGYVEILEYDLPSTPL